MRASILLTILGLLPSSLPAQTPVFGIVNSYYKVLGVDVASSGIKLDAVSGLSGGDRVMIIQMKGATVNTTTNSSSFGSITSLNNAGNYELATVCAIRSDSVFFIQQLMRDYNVEDAVQLVRIPRYTDATVFGTLEAAVWDSATGKGGVLAIIVSGTLTLNAPVTANAKGFKGGTFFKDAGGCANNAFQNYAYDPSPTTYLFYSNVQRGAWKGESIASLALNMKGGRGACANGGGGGNNHNNAGGGGSNLTVAGKGGDNTSTTGCQGSFAGIGGYALSSNGGEKIFLGGGGGAGHANNTVSSAGGGFGGGIVFIQAQNLISNGFTISANGGTGGNTSGDGAAGGGGGGTIILSVSNFMDAVSIEARGGNGGMEDDEVISGRCYGEGGGGGGGVVYFSGPQPSGTTNIAGGSKGAKLNSTCAVTTGTNGSAGIMVLNYEAMESGAAAACAGTLLHTEWNFFMVHATGNTAVLHWSVTDHKNGIFFIERKTNNNWFSLGKLEGKDNQTDYYYHDPGLVSGMYQYRVKYVSNQFTSISMVKQILIQEVEKEIVYDPLKKELQILGKLEKGQKIAIFDFSGRCIYRQTISTSMENYKTDVSFLRNGIYVLRTGRVVKKFLVLGF